MRSGWVLTSLIAASLLLGACGSNDLTARGSIEAVDSTGTSTGFQFPIDVRLDSAPYETAGRVTGTCEANRVVGPDGPAWDVRVQIHRGSEVPPTGFNLETIAFHQRTDAEAGAGSIEATIGNQPYISSAGGTCDMIFDYAREGLIGFHGSCPINNPTGGTATLNYELDLEGCGFFGGN